MELNSPTQVRDVTAEQFEQTVVEASHTRPVVVDFWAPWCQPCHRLAPVLEQAAERHAGEVELVKLNIDEAPALAQRYGVQGIPAVKAFRDGAVVAEFTGVQPDQVVAQFFAGLAPSEADRLVVKASQAPPTEREALLREAVESEPSHAAAVVALARLHADRDEVDEAKGLLARLPADDEVRRLAAELELGAAPSDAGDREALGQRADRGDPQAALALGRALAADGEYDEALERLLAAVRDPGSREAARESLLAVFAVLGNTDERVLAARPRLASALF